MSACRLGLCDGTGWIERDERTVEPCACRGGAVELCLVPECRRAATVAAPLCDAHWEAVPRPLRDRLRLDERAWREGRLPLTDLEQSRRVVIDAARQEVMHL